MLPFYFDGDEEEAAVIETTAKTPTSTPTATFSQDDLNRILAEEKRRVQKTNERTIRQLEDLKKTAQLTQEEKEKLETRIEDLKNEWLSKEELAKKEQKKTAEKINKEKEDIARDRDRWKTLYESSTIERDLIDAAGVDAYNPSQILQILKPNTRLVEELDAESKPTGRLVSKVRFAGKDKDGNSAIFELAATEAVKQMKDTPELYGNLFRSGANSGVGGSTTTTNRQSGGPPLEDTAAYRKWRKDHLTRK